MDEQLDGAAQEASVINVDRVARFQANVVVGSAGPDLLFRAFAATFFCVVVGLQQARLDELEASLRPVRARLIATEVITRSFCALPVPSVSRPR
jgi:hypothetical protein